MITRAEADELKRLYKSSTGAAASHGLLSGRSGQRNQGTLNALIKADVAFETALAKLTEKV